MLANRMFLVASMYFARAAGVCYFPDGVTIDTNGFPCNTSTAATGTHCCRTFEACLSGGLCYTQWDSVLNRRSCTDPTFQDPACPKACLSDTESDVTTMLQCTTVETTRMYCCAAEGVASCCGNRTFQYKPGAVVGILNENGINFIAAALESTLSATSAASTNSKTVSSSFFSSSTGASSSFPTDIGTVSSSLAAQTASFLSSSTGSSSSSPTNISTVSSSLGAQTASPPAAGTDSRTVGLAVGIPLGIIALIAFAALGSITFRRGKENKSAKVVSNKQQEKAQHDRRKWYEGALTQPDFGEFHSVDRQEMNGAGRLVELSAY